MPNKLRRQLLDRFLPSRPVVVVLDRDADGRAAELQRTLSNRRREALPAELTDGPRSNTPKTYNNSTLWG